MTSCRKKIKGLQCDGYNSPPLPVFPEPFSTRAATMKMDDVELIARWMSKPHVAVRWNQDWSVSRWHEEIDKQVSGRRSRPAIVLLDGIPLAYIEVYWVTLDGLACYYPCAARDLGIHIAIGEENKIGQGLGRQILRWIAESLLHLESRCDRVVAEPNVINQAALRAFTAAGFRRVGEVVLPHKTAVLMVYPRNYDALPVVGEPP